MQFRIKGLCLLLSSSTMCPVSTLQLESEREWPEKVVAVEAPATYTNADVLQGYPSQPGCYMRMPSRCPKRPMKTSLWRHDMWAEEHKLDEAGCKDRKRWWDKYCEADDSKMLYIESGFPESDSDVIRGYPSQPGERDSDVIRGYPSQPGCYMRAPSRCPKHPMKTQMWRRDSWAEDHAVDEVGCKGRKRWWDKYCEADDSKMLYIKSKTSSEPFSALQLDAAIDWPWSNMRKPHKHKHLQEKVVAVDAPAVDADADVLHGYPSEPGCYVRMPSGCPRKPMKTHMWRHDGWAEQHELDEVGCKGRKRVWDKYCEAEDVKVLFVPKQRALNHSEPE